MFSKRYFSSKVTFISAHAVDLDWSNTWLFVNPFPHNDIFWRPWETSLLKTLWGKGEIARNEQFLLFPQCFLPVWKIFFHFRQIWNCRLQTLSVWKSLKFVVWWWVKELKSSIVWLRAMKATSNEYNIKGKLLRLTLSSHVKTFQWEIDIAYNIILFNTFRFITWLIVCC